MAVSHVCLDCGRDLARDPARYARDVDLWLVTCPRCGSVAPRRRHAVLASRRAWRAAVASVAILLVQVAIFAGLLAIGTTGAVGLAERLNEPFVMDADARVVFGLYFIAFPLALGIWFGAGLAYWRRAWIAFGLSLVAMLALVYGVIGVDRMVRAMQASGLDAWAPVDTLIWILTEFGLALLCGVIATALALAAAPLGGRIGWLARHLERWVFCQRRARRRRMA